jgi:hypothetical protein
MIQRWRATWIDERGNQREFLFDSLNNRMIARIDFQLKCLHVASGAIHVPKIYQLEEVVYETGTGVIGRRNNFLPHLASTQSQLR